MNNVFKHAQATSTSVLLEKRKTDIVLIIEDNGVGFDPMEKSKAKKSGGGLGLIGMQERAAIVGGTLEIESADGEGTTIFVHVPARFVEKRK